MKTKEENIEIVKVAAIEAIENLKLVQISDENWRREFVIRYRPIRLSDVLLAIGKTKRGAAGIHVDALGYMRESLRGFTSGSWAAHWVLKNDSLDSQSPECLIFLATLLS